MKTLHHHRYWSSRRPGQNEDVIDNTADNYWDMDPAKTSAFMKTVQKPWIAFKVLAAGAIRPESGFRYAFENGADFICVGMFDFQVAQNVKTACDIVPRPRPRIQPPDPQLSPFSRRGFFQTARRRRSTARRPAVAPR